MAMYPDFLPWAIEHKDLNYRIFSDKKVISEDRLIESPGKIIRVVPVVKGGGIEVALIGGALLTGAGYAMTTATVGGALAGILGVTAATVAKVGGVLMGMGVSTMLGGLTQLLFPVQTPKLTTTERPEDRPSYAFNGPVNTVAEGNAVPVGYGELIVGSQVISFGIHTEQL
jgi:predicted phage tail protein